MAKIKECCDTKTIFILYILFVIGIYLITLGMIRNGSFGAVLSSPLFWD